MNLELPKLHLTWVPVKLREPLRRTLINSIVAFAMPRDAEPRVLRVNRIIWGVNASVVIITLIVIATFGFHLNIAKVGAFLAFTPIVTVGCLIARRRYGVQSPPPLLNASLQLMVATYWLALLCYPLGSLGAPWADSWLAATDQFIGFDWVAVNQAVARHQPLCRVLDFAYQSLAWQLPLVLTLLALRMPYRRLELFVLSWIIAIGFAVAGLLIAPARTPYIFWGATHGALPELSQDIGRTTVAVLESLRAGGLRNLFDQKLEGLVTLPSFHTSAGVLFAWALWPFLWLRWPIVVLNTVMLVSVPVIGSHYLIDVIAGIGVAIFAIWIANVIDGTKPPRYFRA